MLKLKTLISEVDVKTGKSDEKIISDFFGQDYESFVKKLGTNWQDPKIRNLILGGLKDGNRNDDKIDIVTQNIKVSDLIPTQKEVDMTKSLSFPLTNKFNTLDNILNAKMPIIINKANIVTLNGKYIIDGHHRWSQVYAVNPETIMVCSDLKADWLKPTLALKAVQVGVVAMHQGKVPMATVEGTNLFGIDENTLNNFVEKTLTPEALKIFNDYFMAKELTVYAVKETNNKTGVKKWIWKNVELLNDKNKPIAGATSRDVMPQTDPVEKRAGVLDYLETGVVNVSHPITPVSEPKKVAESADITNLFRKTFFELND